MKCGRRNLRLWTCLILGLVPTISLPITTHAQPQIPRVAVFMSDSLISTTRTLNGAQKTITLKFPETNFDEYFLSGDPAFDSAIIRQCRSNGTSVILTVGSSATKFAKDNFYDIPVIFSSVLYPSLSGFIDSPEHPGGNITGASLDIPIDIQFAYFKRMVPNLKKIGVLYTESTAPLIPSAKVIAQQLGLTLVPRLIKEPRELPTALDSLVEVTDGLWSVADPILFDPQSTKFILKTTLRKMVPFMGFSRHVVESGALFALDFDYKAIGIQAGELINKIIEGFELSELKVTSTDVIFFYCNEKTARHIKIKIPEDLAGIAKEVHR